MSKIKAGSKKTKGNGLKDGWDGAFNQYRLFEFIVSKSRREEWVTVDSVAEGSKKVLFGKNERHLWRVLFGVANAQCWQFDTFEATNEQLCNMMGVSEKTLIKARKNLEDLRFVNVVRGNSSRPTLYRLANLIEEKDEDSHIVITNGVVKFLIDYQHLGLEDGLATL